MKVFYSGYASTMTLFVPPNDEFPHISSLNVN